MARKQTNATNEAAGAAPPPPPIVAPMEDESTTKNLTLDSIGKYVKTCAHPEQCISYVFRLEPVIDMRRVTGPDGQINIEKIDGAPTREHLLAKHGNGVYQISFHDMSRPRARRRVGVTTIEIQEPGSIPLCDPATVVWDHPRNRPYVSALQTLGKLPPGVVIGGAGPVQANGVAVAPVAVPVAALPAARNLAAEVRELVEVGELLRGSAGGAGSGGAGVEGALLLPLLTHMTNSNIALMNQLREQSAGGGGLGQMREMIGLLQTLGWSAPGQAGAAAAAPAAAAVEAEGGPLASLGSIASIVSDVRDMFAMFRGGGAPAGPAGPAAADEDMEPAAIAAPAQTTQSNGVGAPAAEKSEEETMLERLQSFAGPAFDRFLNGVSPAAFVSELNGSAEGRAALAEVVKVDRNLISGYLGFVRGLSNTLAEKGKTKAELLAWIDAALTLAAAPSAASGGRNSKGGR